MEKLKWSQIERQRAIDEYYKNPNFCLSCGKRIEVEKHQVSYVKKKKVCNHTCATNLRWKDKENQLTEHNKNFGKFSELGTIARLKTEEERMQEKYKDIHIYCLNCGREISLEKRSYWMSRAVASKRKFCGSKCVQEYHWKHNRQERLEKMAAKPYELNRVTLGQLKAIRPNSWSEAIRSNAKKIYARMERNVGRCENCGYGKRIDVAHKKALKDFSDSALIAEINNPDNLLGLCPNCHWEFDNKVN